MKFFLSIIICYSLFVNILYAQKQYFVYDKYNEKYNKQKNINSERFIKDSIRIDLPLFYSYNPYHVNNRIDLTNNIDFSEYLTRNDQIGFIGLDYQRFYIALLNTTKKASQNYSVKGKTRVKENVCDFTGNIEIDSFLLSNFTPWIDEEGNLISFSNVEDEGNLISKIYIKKYGKKEYDTFLSYSLPKNVESAIQKYCACTPHSEKFEELRKDSVNKYNQPYQLKFDKIRNDLISKGCRVLHADVFGHYLFQESSVQQHSGILMGQFRFELGVCYDTINDKIIDTYESDIVGDRSSNYDFAGIWISNESKKNKTCCWAVGEPPYDSKMSTNSASDWSPLDEYRNKGWGTYIDCHDDHRGTAESDAAVEAACKKEKEMMEFK